MVDPGIKHFRVKTWRILSAITDPTKTKGENNKALERLLHTYAGTEEKFLAEVEEKCFGGDMAPRPYDAEYQGKPNHALDAPISEFEVRAAIGCMTKNTAAGADKITNAMIRNMSDCSITAFTKFINEHWALGTIPQQWKHAQVILIPKPGKKLEVANLRPISLTSCLGKLYERVINKRLQDHLENNDLMPHNVFGFRPHLSAQDVLLQLKEEVLIQPAAGCEHVVMAVDIKDRKSVV